MTYEEGPFHSPRIIQLVKLIHYATNLTKVLGTQCNGLAKLLFALLVAI